MTTPGHALHAILRKVRNSSEGNVLSAWQSVLGCTHNDVEWGLRHGEVVGLHHQVLQQVLTLPEDDASRERGMRHSAEWYAAVVWVRNWQSSDNTPAGLISLANLDLLATTADVFAFRYGSAPAPETETMKRLGKEIAEWLQLLDETTDLPAPTRDQIASLLRHVQWLIANADTFGTGTVVRASQTAVGKITEVALTQLTTGLMRKRWFVALGSLVVTLGLVNQGSSDTLSILENVRNGVAVLSEIRDSADDLLEKFRPPRALPSAEKLQLEAGTPPADAEGSG